MMDKCLYCGKEVKPGVKFCPECLRNDCMGCTNRYPGCQSKCPNGIRSAEVAAIRRKLQHEQTLSDYNLRAVKQTIRQRQYRAKKKEGN